MLVKARHVSWEELVCRRGIIQGKKISLYTAVCPHGWRHFRHAAATHSRTVAATANNSSMSLSGLPSGLGHNSSTIVGRCCHNAKFIFKVSRAFCNNISTFAAVKPGGGFGATKSIYLRQNYLRVFCFCLFIVVLLQLQKSRPDALTPLVAFMYANWLLVSRLQNWREADAKVPFYSDKIWQLQVWDWGIDC